MNPNNYRPKLTMYHSNPKGTGSAIAFELVPAGNDADSDAGYIAVTLANQGENRPTADEKAVAPSFDWQNAVKMHLNMTDIAAIIQVFMGETESIEDGKGIIHRSKTLLQCIRMSHIIEPIPCYKLMMFKKPTNALPSDDAKVYTFVFTPTEALGLTMALENALGVVCFGIPQVMRRS